VSLSLLCDSGQGYKKESFNQVLSATTFGNTKDDAIRESATNDSADVIIVPDIMYPGRITGLEPLLDHCLFYQPFLVSELSLYPEDFVRKSGLKNIVLVDKLAYMGQRRKAIPISKTGTLYLDPEPEIIYYLQDVFHHEYFHLVDEVLMKLFASHQSYKWEHEQQLIESKSKHKFIDFAWANINSIIYNINVSDFHVPQNNPSSKPHFAYGKGGAFVRDNSQFIQGSTDVDGVVKGFLNRYDLHWYSITILSISALPDLVMEIYLHR
jgi:hypothetical protein